MTPMKRLSQGFAGVFASLVWVANALAQQDPSGSATSSSTTTTTTTQMWYGHWWVWAVGVGVFLVVVIALTNRGGRSSA